MSIEIRGISKKYGQQKALDQVTLSIRSGEVVGLLGPNGAGKSTLMKILTTYLPPSEGSASVMGHDVMQDPMEVRRRVGYLPENNPLYTEMYVREYLGFAAGVHGLKDPAEAVARMIEVTGLGREQHKRIAELSKGYRQRVGLAQALIHDPDVLILDEPTSGLDPNQLADIRGLIKELGREKTVILSTHIMQEVEAVCDRAVIIHLGKLVADSGDKGLASLRSRGKRIRVEIEGDAEAGDFREIDGITTAQASGKGIFEIGTKGDADLRGEIFNLAVARGWKVLGMDFVGDSLEDVFRQLTR